MSREGKRSDGYVRIPTSALPAVELRHLFSEKDSSIAVPPDAAVTGTLVTGITEWVGSWQNGTISVGWDWGVVNGITVLLSQNEIRTNIQLISPDHHPEPPQLAKIYLFHWIESMPWREVALVDLLARE